MLLAFWVIVFTVGIGANIPYVIECYLDEDWGYFFLSLSGLAASVTGLILTII